MRGLLLVVVGLGEPELCPPPADRQPDSAVARVLLLLDCFFFQAISGDSAARRAAALLGKLGGLDLRSTAAATAVEGRRCGGDCGGLCGVQGQQRQLAVAVGGAGLAVGRLAVVAAGGGCGLAGG